MEKNKFQFHSLYVAIPISLISQMKMLTFHLKENEKKNKDKVQNQQKEYIIIIRVEISEIETETIDKMIKEQVLKNKQN